MNQSYTIRTLIFLLFSFSFHTVANAQLVINEGSNRNFSSMMDEDGEYPDWVELYNSTPDTINLLNYSLSDDSTNVVKWTFPNVNLLSHHYMIVFCSGKDRKPISGFVEVLNTGSFTPVNGWNTHNFTTPYYWDGVSSLLINTCSFSSNGYTVNSVFNQTNTSYPSTIVAFQDGSAASCSFGYGTQVNQRPNIKLNGHQIGFGVAQNCNTCYPAPYGNWYWGAKNQMVIPASELIASGLTAGYINNLSFDIAAADPAVYDYIDFNIKMVSYTQVSGTFEPVNPNNYLHTNFSISSSGEKIFLYDNNQNQLSSLMVGTQNINNTNGLLPDASTNATLFATGTPGYTNYGPPNFLGYALPPTFSVNAGIVTAPFNVSITNPNASPTMVRYTLNGSDPTSSSPIYNGSAIQISQNSVLKAQAFVSGYLPSSITTATYLFNISSSVPVLSVVTDGANLYGNNGIFDNWWTDWQKPAYAEYFDTSNNLIFSQPSGIQMDGGAGGSRSQPQHSFRLELDNSVLGGGTVTYPFIPDRPNRTKYSNFYLRNGSNQFLTFPYKDAAQTKIVCDSTNGYYSAWRPVSVYINGSYFGLYELREKFDTEYFKTLEQANPDSTMILSLSYWYGQVLRSLVGSVDTFWNNYNSLNALNTNDTAYWSKANRYFDMAYYNDYIIGQSWMGNVDWPFNNIKIYRSNKTNYAWRFATVDLELAMGPNSWTDCYFDHIAYMLSQSTGNPYINIWLKGLQNDKFRNYFINRYADVMNTAFLPDRTLDIDLDRYNQTVAEMNNEYARWGDPNNVGGQMNSFWNNHMIFRQQLSERSNQVRDHVQNNFGLPQQVDLTLDVFPNQTGKIHISTITPQVYPWQGIYFDGLPIKIEAIAEPGFHFLHWVSNGLIADTLNSVWLDTLHTNVTNFTAVFIENGVGIENTNQSNNNFNVFPSPATNQLYLMNNNLLNATEAEILDVAGRIVLNQQLEGTKSETLINISELPSGVYMLKIKSNLEILDQLQFVKISD